MSSLFLLLMVLGVALSLPILPATSLGRGDQTLSSGLYTSLAQVGKHNQRVNGPHSWKYQFSLCYTNFNC
jgi:hypothetical protein